MIYAHPNSLISAYTESGAFDSGLVGTLSIRVENTSDVVVVAPKTTEIVEIASETYAASAVGPLPSTQGRYAIIWDDGAGGVALEELEITYSSPGSGVEEPGLVTLDEMKVALNLLDSTEFDQRILQSIPEAEAAIFNMTNRTFDVAAPDAVATPRTFEYSESGIIELADAQHGSVTEITAGGRILTAEEYSIEPSPEEYPVAWWLEMNQPGLSRSPEMGFTRNEDVVWREGRLQPLVDSPVTVTAIWGWPAVPMDVRRAAIWTVAAFMERPTPYVSESIAGYSRTSPNPLTVAIPARARALLDFHVKGGGD